MSVQRIVIKEFKKLENFEKEIAGQHILIMGENGVGKSTVIQFIEIALGKQSNIPPGVNGSGEVTITKDGNPVLVKVKVKDGKAILDISGRGVSISNKKGAIAELFGAVDFDIDEFVDLSKSKAGRKEQVEIFKGFLDPELQKELAKHEANVQNAVKEREALGRDVKNLKGAIASHPLKNLTPEQLMKIQPVDVSGLMAQLKKEQHANSGIDTVENGIADFKGRIAEGHTRVAELQAKINKINDEIEAYEKKISDGREWLKTHHKTDTTAIEQQIGSAAEINTQHQQATSLLADYNKLKLYEDGYGEATALIDSSREAIANAIREQEGPIEDLTYDDEQLIYKGIPVHPDSLSTSEVMELGIRLKMAENPTLGILFIQRAESLGAERFKLIKDIADKAGWQLICEQVERGNKELHIEIMTEELIGA